jgi:hypothetical protein
MLDTLSTSISNMISLLLHSLSFSSLLPAFVFVVLNERVVLSLLSEYGVINFGSDFKTPQLTFWTLLMTVLIGYILRTLNFSIISLFEGYPFRLTWFGRPMTILQRWQRHQLEEMVENLTSFIPEETRKLPLEVVSDKQFRELVTNSDLYKHVERETAIYGTKLKTLFPYHESAVAPTALGNAIAAFEEYPKTRYGIDAVFLWPRLVPILSEEKYAIFVEKEKAGLDFLLNLSLLMGIFAIECLVLTFIGVKLTPLLPTTALGGAYLLYRGSIQAASNWGETVKAAFDSYRHHLALRLSMEPFQNFSEEFARWRAISEFIIKDEKAFNRFDYPLPKASQQESKT